MECASVITRPPLSIGRNHVLDRASHLGTPLRPSNHTFRRPLPALYARNTRHISVTKTVLAKETDATGRAPADRRAPTPVLKHTLTRGTRRTSHVAPLKAVAVAEEASASKAADLTAVKIQLTVVTGMEGDAGMNGDANVTFIAKDGKRCPPRGPGILIRGPFKNDAKKPPTFDMELPPGFDVAGIILYNPTDNQVPRRVLAWLADRLNIKIPFFNGNVLNFLTRKTNLQGLTNGDWYVSRLEIVNKEGGGYSTFDTGNRPPGTEGIDKVFPLYGWIKETTTRIAFEGTAYLPQDPAIPQGLQDWRRRTLITNQNAYNFQPYNDLSKPHNNDDSQSPDYRPVLDPYPQHIRSDRAGDKLGPIPRDEQFGLSKNTDFESGTKSGVLNLLAALIYDPQIFPSIGRALLLALGTGFLVGYLAESGASEAFLDSIEELRPAFLSRELEQALVGGVPAGVFAGLVGAAVPGRVTLNRVLVPGGIGGALVGLLTGKFGALPAGLGGGLLAMVAVGAASLKKEIPKLTYKSVDAYAKACFGRQYRVPFTDIEVGYKKPFVYKLGLDDPEKEWKTDFMFGWQTVAGINPKSIKLVKEEDDLTKGGTITVEDLEKVKAEFPEFAQELKDGKVYLLDFSVLEEFRKEVNADHDTKGKSYLYAPVVILHQDPRASHGVPIPIAIKLSQGEEQIITPGGDKSEGKWGWTLAKAMASSANSGVHQLVQHWLRTHAVCETYGIAIRRQLSEAHPLFKLLIPHTRYTMDINKRAREKLINTGGVIETNFTPGGFAMRVSAAGYRGWRFLDEDPLKDLELRGLLEEDALPNYPYRAHALEVWAALQEYTADYVDLYYKNKEDIAFDYELQAFWGDVKRAHSSLDTWLNMVDPNHKDGLEWPELETKEDLAHILAIMIWAGSAMHSTVNFGQYDYSGFVPNAPASIRQKFDYSKLNGGVYTEKDFMAAMPTAYEMTTVMTVVQSLVVHSVEEQYLGRKQDPLDPSWKFADPWLTEPKAVDVYNKFVDRTDLAQEKLVKMNAAAQKNGGIPYYYLLPHPQAADVEKNIPAQGVPNSVTI